MFDICNFNRGVLSRLMNFVTQAHNYDRHLRRIVLSKVRNIRKLPSSEFDVEVKAKANSKISEIRSLLQNIDQPWISSTFLNIFFLPSVLFSEHKIIVIFSEATSAELNIIITTIELALIFYKMKDHKIARRANRTKLLSILAVDRLSELNVPSKAVLLDSLQQLKLSANPQCEVFVKKIICHTKTDELSELKSMTDSKGDINSMHHLVYKDIRRQDIKEEIIGYIAAQARIQEAHTRIGSRISKKREKLAWRKILSDVDDTLSCSGGSWPSGMDTSYPKHTIYPGVLSFYRELDLGCPQQPSSSTAGSDPVSDEWDSSSQIGNLVFLSARPHVYKDVAEGITYKKIKKLQDTMGLYTSASVLAGSLDTGSRFMVYISPITWSFISKIILLNLSFYILQVNDDCEPLAQKKFENFSEYLALYPEFSCIFIGDNGQGDVRSAEMILEHPKFKGNLQRAYIHKVKPLSQTYVRNPESKQQSNPNIFYFVTYVAAAIDAYNNKLIRLSGLRRIMQEAVNDFQLIEWKISPTATSQEVSNHKGPLTIDPNAASPQTPLRPFPSLSFSSSYSKSTFPGRIDIFSPPKGPQHQGTGSATSKSAPSAATASRTDYFSTRSKNTSPPVAAAAAAPGRSGDSTSKNRKSRALRVVVSIPGNRPFEVLTISPPMLADAGGSIRVSDSIKRELRTRELNHDIDLGNEILVRSGLPPVDRIPFVPRRAIGTIVNTVMGRGPIVAFRATDGMFEVHVPWVQAGNLIAAEAGVGPPRVKVFLPGSCL
jgi:hypothetical protein